MRRMVDGGFSEAWQDKRMPGNTRRCARTQQKGPEPEGPGLAETFFRPSPAIPRWGAPQQSPTPFRRAIAIIPHDSPGGRKRMPAKRSKIDISAYRVRALKIDTSAYRVRTLKIDTKRLPGRCLAVATIALYTTATIAIIVRRTSPPSTHCRF